MPPPVADQSKVQKRKIEMGHGSLSGNAMEGYGKSPVASKPKLKAPADLSELENTLSPAQVGSSKRRSAAMRHPHSAPTRPRKLSATAQGFPSVPDLFGNDDTLGNINHKSKSTKERSARKFNASMPLGMMVAPDLNMDSSEDSDSINPPSRIEILKRSSSADHERKVSDSLRMSSISTSNFLDCIPENKVKKNNAKSKEKEIITKQTSLATSSSWEKKGSPHAKARRSASASPGTNKQKYVNRSSAPVVPDIDAIGSPKGRGKKTMVVKPTRSLSMSAMAQSTNESAIRGKSPSKRSSNYHRGDSDLGQRNASTRYHSPENQEGLVFSSSHSRTEEGVAKRSSKQINAMQAPLTWQNDRDSRKLNSSNLKEKIGRFGSMPVLHDSEPPDTPSKRRSQRQSTTSFGLSQSYHNKPSLDNSLRASARLSSPRRSSSQPPISGSGKRVSMSSPPTSDHAKRVSQTTDDLRNNLERDKRKSASTHVSRTVDPRHSAHQRMSQSAHVRSSFAMSSKDVLDSTTIPRPSMRVSSAHKSGGVVGSVVNLVDKVLESTTTLPASKYGLSEREKARMVVDDDSVAHSFADEDIEARGDQNTNKGIQLKKTPAGKDSKKTTHEKDNGKSFHVPKIMEMTLGIEKQPPMTLVLVWCLIVAELTFDFVTTVISFKAFSEGALCCGYLMNLGILPVAMTVPFFFLVMAESLFLFIAITLSLWPSIVNMDLEGRATKIWLLRPFMCCLKWNATVVLHALNVTVILNPFFGCVIAFMLLYQSNKSQSFLVLGLEGGSIVLHFTSVWLEGSCKSCKSFCFHCVQLIPFLTSVTLILLYLKQGGMCYMVEDEKFSFSGCELCPDGLPPIGDVCQLRNGTNVTVGSTKVWEVQGDFTDLANALTARSVQGMYCASDHPDGPDENFCFFEY